MVAGRPYSGRLLQQSSAANLPVQQGFHVVFRDLRGALTPLSEDAIETVLPIHYNALNLLHFDCKDDWPVVGYARQVIDRKTSRRAVFSLLRRRPVGDLHRGFA